MQRSRRRRLNLRPQPESREVYGTFDTANGAPTRALWSLLCVMCWKATPKRIKGNQPIASWVLNWPCPPTRQRLCPRPSLEQLHNEFPKTTHPDPSQEGNSIQARRAVSCSPPWRGWGWVIRQSNHGNCSCAFAETDFRMERRKASPDLWPPYPIGRRKGHRRYFAGLPSVSSSWISPQPRARMPDSIFARSPTTTHTN